MRPVRCCVINAVVADGRAAIVDRGVGPDCVTYRRCSEQGSPRWGRYGGGSAGAAAGDE